MNKHLTDPLFWKNYWEAKQNLIVKINPKHNFHKLLKQIIKEKGIRTAIELGGFPGYYSVFLRKYFGIDITLFDYFIHKKIIEDLLLHNNLAVNDITIIEADLFTYKPQRTYDMVCSFGLIEHFSNTENIIDTHLNYLNNEGTLLITLPNFKGINGWVQKTFDRYNYDKHFIACMDLVVLKEAAQKVGLKNIRTFYYGGFSVWLENKKEKPFLTQLFVKFIWVIGKVISKIVPRNYKLMSPYIVLIANK